MDYGSFLRKIPKVELHCHLEGAVRAETLAELATKHGIQLPSDDASKLYEYGSIYDFLKIYGLVCEVLKVRDDFRRAAYETLEDGVRLGNLRYREMFWNPQNHFDFGVSYETQIDGLIDGLKEAEADLGVRCRLLAAINRQKPPAEAVRMVEMVVEQRRDQVIGIAMDHAEALGPPEGFAEAYSLAARAGLHRTAHACEDAPPKNVLTCLDELGCERIDHGYLILEDPKVVQRARDEGVFFTACLTSTAQVYGWRDLPNHPIKRMVDQGLRVMLNSDDPPMFQTDIGEEYVRVCTEMEYGPDMARGFALAGVEAAWLDDDERRRMRRAFEDEISSLQAELALP
jgi:adenosine deaminase